MWALVQYRDWSVPKNTYTGTYTYRYQHIFCIPAAEEGVNWEIEGGKRQRVKGYYDRTSKVLPEQEIGQEVRIAGQRNKIWEAGTCVQKLSDLSYLVEVNGNTLRRNREALRPREDTQMTGETTVAVTKPPTSCSCTDRSTNSIEEYQSQWYDHTSLSQQYPAAES